MTENPNKYLINYLFVAQVEGNLRIMLISRLGFNGHQETIDEAQRQFGDYVNGNGSIHENTRQAIYSVVAFNGNPSTVDQFLEV